MISFFTKYKKAKFAVIWQPLIHQAQTQLLLETQLPALKRKDIWLFIDEWNRQYEQSNNSEKSGLAVLAYRLDIHRYAAGMLINGKPNIRLSGIMLLGYMGDETAWPLLKSLINDAEIEIAQAAFEAMKRINHGRAICEVESAVNHLLKKNVNRNYSLPTKIKT